MTKATIGGNEIYYCNEQYGKEKTIVFCNALGTRIQIWQHLLAMLSSDFNIVRYDMRGHGLSTVASEACTIADLGYDVISLLDHLNIDKAILCGLSMGSLVVQWLGANYPQRFTKIVLASTAVKFGTHQNWQDRITKARAEGVASLSGNLKERWFTPGFGNNYPEITEEAINDFNHTDLLGYIACCNALSTADFTKELKKMIMPVLLIVGKEDKISTLPDADFIARQIPKATICVIEGAHLSPLENPQEFAKHLTAFAK